MARASFSVCLVVLTACGIDDGNLPADGPPPVSGGGLHVTPDGRFAIASDPDRASIHVVDLFAREEAHRIELGDEDEPGRVISDADGRVHVVLRRAGEVATLTADLSAIATRRRVCQAARGIDFDETTGELVVACAEGALVFLPADGGEVTHAIQLEPDLRDVIARGGDSYLVSRFRRAEVLVVEAGVIARRIRPPEIEFDPFSSGTPVTLVPTVAWRMRDTGAGVLLVHQYSTGSQLGTLGVASGVYYGGDCQLGVVRSVVSLLGPGDSWRSAGVESASLVVDGDVAGTTVALAAAGEGQRGMGGPFAIDLASLGSVFSCGFPTSGSIFTGYPEPPAIAVETLPTGERVTQLRDPARLVIIGPSGRVEIDMSGGSAAHFGYSIFHETAGTGATCASCHPEGGDDGHVWRFDVGQRRTQTLTGGILATAPFHWAGDVADVTAVMDGTFVGRMGGERPREYETESLATWMDALPALHGPRFDEAAASRGRTVFDASGCADCHSGAAGTNNATVDVASGRFQVPALTEVAFHEPYLHDGRAATLETLLGMHGDTSALSDGERTDLTAYLRSL